MLCVSHTNRILGSGRAAAARPQAAPRRRQGPPPRRSAAAAGQQATRAAVTPAAASSAGAEFVKRATGGSRGKPVPVRPELAAELQPLAALFGMADAAALSWAVTALGPMLERRVLQHGPAVAQWLLSLGVPRQQLAQLLHRCPLLFSRSADERAAVLFGQLARLGLTAAEAARCFQQDPTAAGIPSFDAAITELAAVFATGSGAGSGRSGEQLLGDLLRRQPAAVGLLKYQAGTLQERVWNLVQRYGPHWDAENKQAMIVAAMRKSWALVAKSPAALLAREAVLQQELGQQPGDGMRLLAAVVQRAARAASCSPETLRQRLLALLVEFGLEALLQAGSGSIAELLAVATPTWQRVLVLWRLLGVADPAALGLRNTRSLTLNWLAAERLASLAALQRLLPWRPTAAAALQQHGVYVANYAPARLIGRLLFLQQEGLLPLLVPDKLAELQQWRQERGLPANRRAEDEPQLISLRDAAVLPDAKFCALLAQAQAAQLQQTGNGGGTAERYRAFMAQLPQLPGYQQLLAEGAAESRRLAALLPPELAAGQDET